LRESVVANSHGGLGSLENTVGPLAREIH
jgi:hypothetical protein